MLLTLVGAVLPITLWWTQRLTPSSLSRTKNTHDSTLHYRTVYLSPKPCTLNPPSEARSPALQLGCLSVILVVSLVAYVHLLPYKENAGSLEHNACRLARS